MAVRRGFFLLWFGPALPAQSFTASTGSEEIRSPCPSLRNSICQLLNPRSEVTRHARPEHLCTTGDGLARGAGSHPHRGTAWSRSHCSSSAASPHNCPTTDQPTNTTSPKCIVMFEGDRETAWDVLVGSRPSQGCLTMGQELRERPGSRRFLRSTCDGWLGGDFCERGKGVRGGLERNVALCAMTSELRLSGWEDTGSECGVSAVS